MSCEAAFEFMLKVCAFGPPIQLLHGSLQKINTRLPLFLSYSKSLLDMSALRDMIW